MSRVKIPLNNQKPDEIMKRLKKKRPLDADELQQLEAYVTIGPVREDISEVLAYYNTVERIAQRLLRDIRSTSSETA